jgi:hypothetical protein
MERRAIPGTKIVELLAAVTFKHEPLPFDDKLNPVEHVVQAVADVQAPQLAAQAVQLTAAP